MPWPPPEIPEKLNNIDPSGDSTSSAAPSAVFDIASIVRYDPFVPWKTTREFVAPSGMGTFTVGPLTAIVPRELTGLGKTERLLALKVVPWDVVTLIGPEPAFKGTTMVREVEVAAMTGAQV